MRKLKWKVPLKIQKQTVLEEIEAEIRKKLKKRK